MAKMKNYKRLRARKRILLESSIAFFIVLSPFIFKAHVYFPQTATFRIDFLGIEIKDNGFEDVNTYVWFLVGKIVPLYLLILWFLSSRDWWYHIILIPIAMYAFQLFEVLFINDEAVDTANLLWLLPICMIVIPFVYFIRIKLYDKYVHGIDLEAMEAELEELKEKNISDGYTSNIKNDIEDTKDELNQESLAEEIDRKLSTDSIEQGLKIFQEKLQNWFHFKF
ncbi:hypothetical protein DZC72_12560 [Maribacter algicola]|uniref:Uncharacterized protein n=2 Tax=Maribacter algicola TaxID=2498892 RepID=A0A426RHQ3_9FLAO|nr:hypothetical protein DZC72_12560 [Maribacter algicola]